MTMVSQVDSVTADPLGVLEWVHPRLGPPGELTSLRSRTMIDGTDTDLTYTIGLHWHPDTIFPYGYSPIRFGAVYHHGEELLVDQIRGTYDGASPGSPFVPDPLGPFPVNLSVPDRFGVGVSYQTPRHWLFSLDFERVDYEDLLDGFESGVNLFTGPLVPYGDFLDSSLDLTSFEFEVDNAIVGHGGIEYTVHSPGGQWTYSIRAGYFNAPDNRIRLASVDTGDEQLDAIFMDIFRGGEDFDHFTAGVSLGTPEDFGVTLQFAADLSDEGDQYLFSAIYRFGRTR
jgi:hypothetical protein